MSETKSNVCVVVLGDVGRSPRMQYHATSFLKEGYNVDVIGYDGSSPLKELQINPSVKLSFLSPSPNFSQKFPLLIAYGLKVIWQCITLFWSLLWKRRSDYLIVQTPPAIPALMVCWLYCFLVRAKFVIDWHNYGFSILALTHGEDHKIVRISKWFEGFFGRKANGNLCVTKAMKEDLKKRWDISAVTLYDRPQESFRSVTVNETHDLLEYYSELSGGLDNCTRFTKLEDNGAKLREDRPGLLVSSTSWTEDEDFSILLSALREYEENQDPSLPKLVVAITGKGPLKEYYLDKVAKENWSKVSVISLWLESEDYPVLLASADLGVSLHMSSSGLDLPMKVVDMFGCGLPVAALHFKCLDELVRHQINGLVFHDSKELSEQIQNWFRGFPNNQNKREQYKEQISQFQKLRWHENWSIQALPLFQ